MLQSFLAGLGTTYALIAAIGAQNAFVLRQGLLRQHVLAVSLFCALSDAVLISAGVAGAGVVVSAAPGFLTVMLWGGAAFLVWYGFRSLRAAWQGGQALGVKAPTRAPLGPVLLMLAAITWLNPHVYLDTVVLLGALSAQYPHRWLFGVGAMMASLTFFLALGFGARLLAPVFAKPAAWQVLDALVGLMMWAIALALIWQALA